MKIAVLVPALVLVCSVNRPAAAEPWRVQLEGGAEVDSNVERLETGPELENRARTAPLVRTGTRVSRSTRRGAGGHGLHVVATTRTSLDRRVKTEDVATLGGDTWYLHPLGPVVAIGGRVNYVEAIPLAGVEGTRTFRTFAGEANLVLRHGERGAVTVAAGGRYLAYKPDHDFDWLGPSAELRFARTLWQNAENAHTVELTLGYRLDRRSYAGLAFANRCEPGADPSPMCFAPTDIERTDLHHAAAIEASYTGDRILSVGYQLVVIDSNSYGQSLIRHRITLSATDELPWGFVGTATVTGQFDQHLDSMVVSRDVQHQSFSVVDDDNRSAVQLRIAHALGARLSLEIRTGYWTDLYGPPDIHFRRFLAYGGLMWAND